MNRKVLSVLTVVLITVFTVSIMAQPPQGPGGTRRAGRGKGGGFRGKLMRQHIAQCSECAEIAEQIKKAKGKLKELREKIQQHHWKKALVKINEFKEQNPDKADDVDKLIELRKTIRRHQNKITNLRKQARALSQKLGIPAEVMKGAFGWQHGPGAGGGFGDRVGQRLSYGPGAGPGMMGPGPRMGPAGPGHPGPYPGKRSKGPGRWEGREQWQQKRLERLVENDPELHGLLTEQREIRERLRGLVDQLTDSVADHILSQLQETVEEE